MGQLLFITNSAASGADVTSVFGRIGAVVAVGGDYGSDEITNESGVVGATVSDALDQLDLVAVKKFSATFGDGVSTSYSLTHSLGTKDIISSVRQVSDDVLIDCDTVSTSTTQVTYNFVVAPSLNSLRATVHA